MVGAGFRAFPQRFRLRRWAAGLCAAGFPLLTAGCTSHVAATGHYGTVVAAAGRCAPSAGAVRQAAYQPTADDKPAPAPVTVAEGEPTPTPINLDSVFHIAEERNAQIAVAREKLNESQAENDLAAKGWMPKVTAGVAYYRHEGGIQNEDGTLTRSSFGALYPGVDLSADFDIKAATIARIDAERKRWQQQGEVSRVTNEQLLEAANTYIDLITARRGEAVARELEKYQRDALKRANALAPEGGKVLVESVEAELRAVLQAETKLRQQGDAASAKLAYLLGMDPLCPLVPVDETLSPIDLVDATAPTAVLVGQALADGPGVRELQGMLAVIDCGMAELSGPKMLLPTVGVCLGEGSFGAGPDSSIAWSNRFDVGVQARWNVTELFKARDEKRIVESKRRQVQLTYDDLRGKLTLGVREAREAILSGREQIGQASEQIQRASEAYRLSDLRLKQNAPGSSVSEVVQSLRGLEEAHFNYVNTVSAYNKAQIRLLLLLGPAEACRAPGAPAVIPTEPPAK